MLLSTTGCSDDVEHAIPPTSEDAIFSISYDPENPNKVHFLAEPAVATWYTHWSFGDKTSFDGGLETTKTYLKKGEYEVEFSAKGGFASGGNTHSLPSGIYFYSIRAGSFSETKKMLLIK